MNYQKVYMNQIHSSSLLCQLSQMWRSQLLCDALICTGNVVTKAHRVVLLAACPMLQSMENASIGTELEVRLAADIKQEAVNTFLQYLYEGFMLLTEDNVKHVEKVARLLQVDSVIKCCSDFFKCLEKSTGKVHNANYKFDKYDLLEFRHVRATGLQKTYQERLMKRMSESPRPTSPGKRQRLHPRPSTPTSDFTSQRADDAVSMTQSYMTGIPTATGSVRSGTSNQSSRSGSPSVVEIIEDSLELIQKEKVVPGQPEPPRLAQQKTSISVASHVSNVKDTRVVTIADDSGGGRTRVTDSFSDRTQNIPSSPQQSSQTQMPVSPKISFRDSHPQNIQYPSPTSFISRVPPNQMSFTSQPPPPPLQQAGTLNIAPLPQTFSQDRFQPRSQDQQSSQSRPPQSMDFISDNAMNKTSQSFMTSTPQRTHLSFPPISGAKPSFAAGSAAQAGMPSSSPSFPSQSTSQQQDSGQVGISDKGEKREAESVRPQEGHDPGPIESKEETPDLAIVKIEKVGEDETGGLLLHVDSGQGDGTNQMHRMGQFSIEEEQEYDESDLTGDWSQEDVSNEGSLPQEGEQLGSGAMYMGPTSGSKTRWHDRGPSLELAFVREHAARTLHDESNSSNERDISNQDAMPTEENLIQTESKISESSEDRMLVAMKLQEIISTPNQSGTIFRYPCSRCYSSCDSKEERDAHIEMFHKYVCNPCQKSFTTASGLYSHNRMQHGTGSGLLECKICGKKLLSKARLAIHERSHSHKRMFRCIECGRSYKHKYSLDAHHCEKKYPDCD